jgi:hypothetical protein
LNHAHLLLSWIGLAGACIGGGMGAAGLFERA